MKKFFLHLQSVLLAGLLVGVFAFSPLLAMARGYDSKPVTGVYKLVETKAVTATGCNGYDGTSGTVADCSFFYVRPYTLDSTLDLVVQAGANSYTATYTYKIKAASGNVNAEFGPFYMDETDADINYYVSVTTVAAPAYSATVYVRSYRPAKHNY